MIIDDVAQEIVHRNLNCGSPMNYGDHVFDSRAPFLLFEFRVVFGNQVTIDYQSAKGLQISASCIVPF